MRIERLVRYAAVWLILFLAIGYLLLSFPANREDTRRLLDFSEFYAAGQIVRQGMGSSLYDLRLQSEFQVRVAPVHAFYLRPPFEALLFVPLTYLSYKFAYATWVIFSLGLLAIVAKIIQRNTNVLLAVSQYARGIPVDFGLLVVLFLTFAPIMDCLLIGQDAVLMLVVYSLVYVALKGQRELEAGAILGCGLFKFHFVLPFVLIFALRRRWRFLAGFAGVAVVLALLSVLISGPEVIVAYPRMFLNSDARRLMGFQPEYAPNIRGLVYLLGGSRISTVVSAAIVASASIVLLWIAARNWSEHAFDLSFSAAVIATLLTGYHAFVYDLSLLLLPVGIVCGNLANRGTLLRNSTLNACLLILFIPPVHHFLIVYHLYALLSVVLLAIFAQVSRAAIRYSPELPGHASQ